MRLSRTVGLLTAGALASLVACAAVLSGAAGAAPLPTAPSLPSPPVVDITKPTISVAKLPQFGLGRTVTVNYSGQDAGSGVANYDVRYQASGWGTSASSGFRSPAAWQARTQRSVSFGTRPGSYYCVQVRARDKAGNVSDWSGSRCTAIAQDDRALTASKGWTRATSKYAYRGTVTRSATFRAALSTTVRGQRMALVATTCPTCGRIAIILNGDFWRYVSTQSKHTRNHAVIVLPPAKAVVTVKVRIVVSGTRPVNVDGLAVSGR